MTVAYDALLASATPDSVVLAEPQPMVPLGPWTAAGGGLTNTYYAPWAQLDSLDIVAGGLYRRLDQVRQNDTALTSRASAALVDANLGSYFHDTANDRIYVSTSTGASPDSFALVGVWFTLFFSTVAVSFADQPLYWPVIADELPTLSSAMPDMLYGAMQSDEGSLTLLNFGAVFDRLSRRYVWRNKKITFKLGGVSLAYSDFATVGSLRINGMAVDDERAVFQLEGMGSILNQSIPTRTWGDGTFSWSPTFQNEDGALSRVQPWIFGAALDCPLTLKDRTVGTAGQYATVDSVVHFSPIAVNAVYAVNKTTQARTLLANGIDYALGTNNWDLIISNATYMPDAYEIRADLQHVSSMTFGAFGVQLLGRCGESSVNMDLTSAAAADVAAPQRLGLCLFQPTKGADVKQELEQSVNGQLYVATDGRWTWRVWNPSSPQWTLTDADFVAWEPADDLQGVLNEVRAQFKRRWATDDAIEASSSDDAVRYGSETSDSHRIRTFLTNPADVIDSRDAAAVASRHRFLKGAPAALIRFEERGLTLMGASVGDFIAVTRARGPVARTGAYEGQLLQLVALEKSLTGPTVRGVLSDMGGNADRIARYGDTSVALTWSAATAEERAFYGFYCDANGYIDAADAQTRNAKVYS